MAEKDVLEIINMLLNKIPYRKIMDKFNISKSTISAIKNKRLWRELTKDIKF